MLLLNASPGTDGKIDEAQAARFKEFGEAIRETFKTDLAQGAQVVASSVRGNDIAFDPQNVLDGDYDTYWTMDDGQTQGTLTVYFDGEKTFDVVSIQEYIKLGQRISDYDVEAYYDGEWHTFGNPDECQTIGYKALVRGDITKAEAIRIISMGVMMIPPISLIVGTYSLMVKVHLNDTLSGLILLTATLGIPACLFMYCAFITTIPKELDEAAMSEVGLCKKSRIAVLIWGAR